MTTRSAADGGTAGGHDRLVTAWMTLLLLQAVVACLVLWPFITGERYFAYLDIASDTYNNATAFSPDLARLFSSEGWTG